MKHIGNELNRIIEERKLVKREIAESCGIHPSYFSYILKSNTMNPETLETICRHLDISPGYFFDDWTSNKYSLSEIMHPDADSIAKDKEIKLLREMLEDKERIIKILSQKSGIDV